MVKCPNCKTKLNYYPLDVAHPFKCPNCGHEDCFLDERTGTVKTGYSRSDWNRKTGTWSKIEKKLFFK